MKIALATPTLKEPHPAYTAALAASRERLDAEGIRHEVITERGCPYISWARANLARLAFRTEESADAIIYLDDDLSWEPEALVKLIRTEGDVVAGTYRYKEEGEPHYMGALIVGSDGLPIKRADGAVQAISIPAGFLKITLDAYLRFARNYPQFIFGPMAVDLFCHGAHGGVWWGEDAAFARNWRERCGDVWLVPDLAITHHREQETYPGNFAAYLEEHPYPGTGAFFVPASGDAT
jgi:hypothetical protein